MKLFKLDANGKLIKLYKLAFYSEEIYVVDEQEIVTIWIGSQTAPEKRESANLLKLKIEKERGNDTKILVMEEQKEYGTFLAIMENLRTGNIPKTYHVDRTELRLEKPEMEKWMEQIEKYREWSPDKQEIIQKKAEEQFSQFGSKEGDLTEDLKTKISIVAYYISQEKYDYNELCWMLAERIMRQQPRASIEEIRLKSEQIFQSSSTYDEICWLIAEMDVLGKEKYLKDTKISFL